MTRRLRPLVALVAMVLVAAGCSSAGGPVTLDDQLGALPDSVPESALAEGQDPQSVPLFQRNFLEGCVNGGRDDPDSKLADVQADALPVVCGCIYAGYAQYYENAAETELTAAGETPTGDELDRRAYELFDKLDDKFRSDPNTDLPAELVTIAADCITTVEVP